MPEPEDPQAGLVEAIVKVDASIARHAAELRRNWMLRESLAQALGAAGVEVAPITLTPLNEVVSEPLRTSIADRYGLPDPTTGPTPVYLDPGTVPDLEPIHLPVRRRPNGSYYSPVMVARPDVPEDVEVWVLRSDATGDQFEAHILAERNDDDRMLVRAECQILGPSWAWSKPPRTEWEREIEICSMCWPGLTPAVAPATPA